MQIGVAERDRLVAASVVERDQRLLGVVMQMPFKNVHQRGRAVRRNRFPVRGRRCDRTGWRDRPRGSGARCAGYLPKKLTRRLRLGQGAFVKLHTESLSDAGQQFDAGQAVQAVVALQRIVQAQRGGPVGRLAQLLDQGPQNPEQALRRLLTFRWRSVGCSGFAHRNVDHPCIAAQVKWITVDRRQ